MCDGSLLNSCYLCQLWYLKPWGFINYYASVVPGNVFPSCVLWLDQSPALVMSVSKRGC